MLEFSVKKKKKNLVWIKVCSEIVFMMPYKLSP